MKQYLLTLPLVVGLSGNAAIIQFDLSPTGTDAATGLSPLNEVPPALGSGAAGAEVAGSVYFDTDTSTFSFAFTYEHLSTPLTHVAIHGPASTGENAEQVLDLAPYHLPAGFPPVAGMVSGTVNYPAPDVSALLEGQQYINIASAVFPNGELRAQLIPAAQPNGAPTITGPGNVVFECGESNTVTVLVDDPDGDSLIVVWEWNGWGVQTNLVTAGDVPAVEQFTGELPLGDSVLSVRAVDPGGAEAVCSIPISVADTIPPVIQSVVPDRTVLWPPDHTMVPVALDAVVTDECSQTFWGLVSVTSNEPDNGRGDGDSSGDCQIVDDHTVLLRAERSGRGQGRVYTLGIQAVDSANNLSDPFYVEVTVPR